MEQQPDQARQILARRRDQLRRNMELTTQGIKRLAESDGSAECFDQRRSGTLSALQRRNRPQNRLRHDFSR
jgi:hypothetical protein